MAVAAGYRVRHSEFLSWDRDDRDKAIWWHLRTQATCPGCGTRAEEWDEARGGHRDAFVAELSRCRGCELRGRAEASVGKDDGRGIRVILTPNPKAKEG